MIRSLFINSCFLFAALVNATAQQRTSEELVQLVNKSFTYNPRINELQQNVLIQEERIDIAKTYLLPAINASATYNYIDPVGKVTFPVGPGEEKSIQFQPNNNISFGLGLNYLALDFGRARAAITKTRNELLQSKDNVEFNKAQLAAQVASIYYGILYLNNAIQVQDSILATLQKTKIQTENKLKNGDALQLDVLTIGSNINAEENRKIELKTLLEKQQNLLAYSTGISTISAPATSISFGAAIGKVSKDELLKQTEQNNFDFKLNLYKTLLTANDWDITKRNYYPSVNVIGNAGMRNGYQPNLDHLKFNYLVGLSLNVPLFQGGRFKQQKQLFEATNKLNELNLTTLKKNYERDIAQSLADINSYADRIENVKGQISQAQRALELTLSRYNNGTALQIEFINALTTLQKIKLSSLNFEYQKCLSQIELSRLSGEKWW